jgi:hypothetical protein
MGPKGYKRPLLPKGRMRRQRSQGMEKIQGMNESGCSCSEYAATKKRLDKARRWARMHHTATKSHGHDG